MEYIRSSVELHRKICPYSEQNTKKLEKLLDQPETHYNYMKIDWAKKLMKVVPLQQSDGSFMLDGAFAELLGSSLEDIFEGE